MPIVGEAVVRVRVTSDRLGNDISDAIRRGVRSSGPDIDREGQGAGARFREGFERETNGRTKVRLGRLFNSIGRDLGNHFNLGIGAARMGEGIISILATAGPSMIAGAGAIGTAMAAEIITAMAAIGPGIGGAIGVGLAGASSLLLSGGLLALAFSLTEETKAITEAFGELRKSLARPIQENMMEGMLGAASTLQQVLPQLNDVLSETGRRFGAVAQKIADTVAKSENMERIKGILSTNNDFITRFGDGLAGLTESFLILFNAAKPFIDYVGQGIQRFGEWASSSLQVAEANGSLAAWMDGMLESFKDLWAITKDFGAGFIAIFRAAGPAGETMLDSIRGIAERFRAWTSDTGNMERMTAFFEKAHTIASKVWEILGAIFTAGGRAFESMDIGPLLHVMDTLQYVVVPAIAEFFNQIQAGASENLVKAFDNIGTALQKIADSGMFEKVAGFISNLLLKVSEFAASDFGATILSWVLPIALMGGIVTALVGPVISLVSGLWSLVGVLGALSAPVVAVGAAVGIIVAAFALMWANSQELRDALSNLAETVGGALSRAWDVVAPKLEVVWGKIQRLAGIIGDRLAPVIEFLTPIVERAIGFIGDLFGNLLDIVGGVIDFISSLIEGDWTGMWNAAGQVVSGLWDTVVNVFGWIKSLLSFTWDAITTGIYNFGQLIVNIWDATWEGIRSVLSTIWDWIKETVMTGLTWVSDTIRSIGQSIYDGWFAFWNMIGTALSTAWEWLKTTVMAGLTWIADTIRSIGQSIYDGWFAFWRMIGDALAAAWEWLKTTVMTGLTWIGDTIRSIGQAIQEGWNNLWTSIGNFLRGIWDGIVSWLGARWNDIRNTAESIWNGITSVASTAWNNVRGAIEGAIQGVVGWLQGLWNDIANAVGSAFNRVISIATTAWNAVYDAIVQPVIDAYNAVVGWVEDIIGSIQNAIDWAGDLISKIADANAAVLTAPSPGVVPGGVGMLGGFNIPNMAMGGIVNPSPGGTLIRVAEAGRRERIEPLNANGLSARDEMMIRAIVAQMGGSRVDVAIDSGGLAAFIDTRISHNEASLSRRVQHRRPV